MDLQPEEDPRGNQNWVLRNKISGLSICGYDSTQPRWHLGIHLFIVIPPLIDFTCKYKMFPEYKKFV